jgi:hypothetical protein
MGMGATNTLDRVAAMMGEIREVPIAFQAAVDVPHGVKGFFLFEAGADITETDFIQGNRTPCTGAMHFNFPDQ